jgi:hypothetical protein
VLCSTISGKGILLSRFFAVKRQSRTQKAGALGERRISRGTGVSVKKWEWKDEVLMLEWIQKIWQLIT